SWDHNGGDEKRRSQRGRIDVHSELTLIDGMQEIGRTPHVQHPHRRDRPRGTSKQRERRNGRENGSDEIAVCSRNGKPRRKRGRNYSRDEEAETDEAKRVRNNQGKKGFFSPHKTKSRDDENRRDNGERC